MSTMIYGLYVRMVHTITFRTFRLLKVGYYNFYNVFSRTHRFGFFAISHWMGTMFVNCVHTKNMTVRYGLFSILRVFTFFVVVKGVVASFHGGKVVLGGKGH